jgi:hypothetical protein
MRPHGSISAIAAAACVAVASLPAQGRGPASDRFATLFPSRVKTFVKAGYDPDDRPIAPAQGNDDGFSGTNGSAAYRFVDNGTGVAALAHFDGRPGVLGLFFRNFWSDSVGQGAWPGENNRTRVWIDGALAHDLPLRDYFRRTDDPRGQIAPFSGPFTGWRSGGHLTHAQLRWQDRFVLGLDDDAYSNAARFHRVAATIASPEGELPIADMASWEEIARLGGGWPHRAVRVPTTTTLNLAAGSSASLVLSGPSTLLEVTCVVPQHVDWMGLRAQFTWDGAARPQVDAPLRLLGAMIEPPHRFPVASLLFGNDGDRRVTCYFPMPFAQQARLTFVNANAQPVALDVTLAQLPGQHPQPWGHFHAVYRSEQTGTGETFVGPKFVDARGSLRMLLLEDSVDNTGRLTNVTTTHLEGDLCVRINGTRGADHTFDASETGIGRWGWYLTAADLPFVSDTSFNSGISFVPLGPGLAEARRIMGSTLVFDPVHFVSGLDVVLEHGIQNSANADYRMLAFCYVEPGAARRVIAELDVGNASASSPVGEPNFQVQYTAWSSYTRQGHFLRDQFYGDGPLADTVRHIRDYLRFAFARPTDGTLHRGLCVGFRVDRLGGTLAPCQAEVYVNGQRAGLLHVVTHSPVFPWVEGGECEVELPRALTDGKATLQIELRPRPGSAPLRVARAVVYEYVK